MSVINVICVLGLFTVAASSESTVEQGTTLEVPLERKTGYIADEAVLVGHILRNAAQELQQDAELESETEEYFIRKLWDKTKAALKKAGQKVKAVAKQVKPHVKAVIKETSKSIVNASMPIIKKKAQEKAIEIATKIFKKAAESYTLEDYHNHTDAVRSIFRRLDQEGTRLIELGEKLGTH